MFTIVAIFYRKGFAIFYSQLISPIFMKNYYFRLGLLLFSMLASQMAYAQITVSGLVTDDMSGEPLIGVNVLDKQTKQGVITDLDGRYTITLPGDQGTLMFSFVGYLTAEREVTSSTNELNVGLVEDIASLEEVVVTGLASSVKRSNLANAVSTVSAKELTGTTSQPSLDGALYGKLTGANIVQSSGAPGGGIAIRLRGVSSIIGQNQPLFIVDGVYLNNAEIPSGSRFASGANSGSEENASNRIADLNPEDIETIEVLKGPSAAAIYGTRANAGVIIITTKKGDRGKTYVRLSQDIGFSQAQRLLGMRNWTEEMVREEFSEEEAAVFAQAQREGRIYDYEEEIYGETGLISNTNLSVTGGGEKTTFFVGANVRDEEGIIKGTGYERNSIRTNIEHKITNNITLSSNTNYVNSTARRGFTGNENDGGLSYGYNLAFTRPWAELHPNEFGIYPSNPYAAGNPLFVRDRTENEETTNRFIQGLKLQTNLLNTDASNLKLVLNGGLDYFMNETYVFVPKEHQAQEGRQNGFLGVGKNEFRNINTQGFLVWDNYLRGGEIVLTSQAGISYLNFNRDLVFNQATQLLPGPPNLQLAGAQEIDQEIQVEEEFGMVFQQEANFNDRIIATLGIRADKSSLNGDPNQYYYFPKASLAWNIANYDFWNVPEINLFKLRAAYGQTGSTAAFGSLYTSFAPVTVGGQAGIIVGGVRGNQDLKPETAAELEFGLDMSFFDNRLGFEATYYDRNVNDLILPVGVPPSSGFIQEAANIADLQNRGFELAVHAQPVTTSALKWVSQTNFWFNRSEITRLATPEAFPVAGSAFGLGLGTFFIEEGQPITQIKGTVDGEVVTVGDVEPDFQLSTFNQLNLFKNFDFNFLVHWKEGGNNLNLTRYLTDLAKLSDDLDTPAGQERVNTIGSLRFIEDASYVRLREVALYYNVPKETVSGLAGNVLSTVRIGVSGRNLLTFTNYSSYDPEVSVKGGAGLSSGAEVAPFPSTKQAFFHLSLGF